MKILKNIFKKKEEAKTPEFPNLTIAEFWKWFLENERRFLKAVKSQNNIQLEFINPVFNKLNQIQKGAYLLTGMMDDNTAELIFTAEGNLMSFPYISELVKSSPQLENWQFTAFKPAMDFADFEINMGPKSFTSENIFFYPEIDENYPDEISIIITYTDSYGENQKQLVEHGAFIFVKNYLGEIKTVTQIDKLSFEHHVNADIELNPIGKLSDYIKWREKEFIEKYDGTIHNSDDSSYSSLEWKQEDHPIFGVVNTDLIRWDKKASHPWIMVIAIKFDKTENNGMPNHDSLQEFYHFEDKLRELLAEKDGYVNVAQITGLGEREIYYANKEYLTPIQVLEKMKSEVNFEYEFEIFKDKYWKCMKHFEH